MKESEPPAVTSCDQNKLESTTHRRNQSTSKSTKKYLYHFFSIPVVTTVVPGSVFTF